MLKLDPDLARQFLEALFGPVYIKRSEKIFIDVRFKKDGGVRRKGFYPYIDNLIIDMAGWDVACDYWIGVAPRKNNKSGTKDACLCWQALFADLDFGTAGHKKPHYPTQDEAQAALEKFPLQPSIIVHSGGGLQPYWLLDPFEMDVGTAERGLQGIEEVLFGDPMNGATILRLPGTFNMKVPGKPRAVTMLWHRPENVYKIADFPGPNLLIPSGKLTGEVQISDEDLLPPAEERPSILQAVDGERNIVAARQAGIYFARGLGEEEVVCLMERWNITLCSPPLGARELGTVIRSIGQAERRKRMFVQSDAPLPPMETAVKIENEEDRTYLFAEICKFIGAPFSISEINRVLGEETKWRFNTSAGKVEMTTAELLSFKSFQVKIANRTGHCAVKGKKIKWEVACQRIMDVATDVDPGPEATMVGLLSGLIKVYLDKQRPPETWKSGHETFHYKERVGIFLTKFQNYLKMHHGVTLDPKSLAQNFTGMGISPCIAKIEGKTRRFWVLPFGFWEPGDE